MLPNQFCNFLNMCQLNYTALGHLIQKTFVEEYFKCDYLKEKYVFLNKSLILPKLIIWRLQQKKNPQPATKNKIWNIYVQPFCIRSLSAISYLYVYLLICSINLFYVPINVLKVKKVRKFLNGVRQNQNPYVRCFLNLIFIILKCLDSYERTLLCTA